MDSPPGAGALVGVIVTVGVFLGVVVTEGVVVGAGVSCGSTLTETVSLCRFPEWSATVTRSSR